MFRKLIAIVLICVLCLTYIPYIVQQGDTLGALAKKFHCTIEEACKWNDITNPNQLQIGQKLIFKF